MPASPAKTIQCFKVGRHVAMSGASINFAQSDLAASAGAYDPALHEAPIVIGHPALDAPAYGYVGGLALAGAALEATPRKVVAEFAEAVRSGHYGKVSAAFFPPDSPHNPVPGVYYLRHIGFLGAMPPAVKGLRDPTDAVVAPEAAYAAFAEAHPDVVVFAEWDAADNASLFRSLRDWVIGKFGVGDADTALPAYLVGSLERSAAQAAVTPDPAASPLFAQQQESTVTEQERLAAIQAENDSLKTQLAQSEKAARDARQAAAHAEHTAFAEGLQTKGIWPKAGVPLVVAALDTLAGADDRAPVEFGEGAERKPLAQALRELLAGLPPRVEFGEYATSARAAAAGGQLDVNDTNAIAFAAQEYRDAERAAGREVGQAVAVAHVLKTAGAAAR